MAVYVNAFFEARLTKILDLANLIDAAFSAAGLQYRVIGGLAAYLYVESRAEGAGRLTRDIDIAVRRSDLPEIINAVETFGLQYRHTAGVDMLIQFADPSARRAVHMVFAGEKVQKDYPEAVPDIGECHIIGGIRLIPIEDLVRMKLTSFRLKDQVHIQDLEEAGVITSETVESLPPLLRERLAVVRASS